jgi:hypothetical protein
VIIDGFFTLIAGIVGAPLHLLPSVALPDPGWSSTLAAVFHSVDAFNTVFPLQAVFVCLAMGAVYLGLSSGYHGVMWLLRKVPFVGIS